MRKKYDHRTINQFKMRVEKSFELFNNMRRDKIKLNRFHSSTLTSYHKTTSQRMSISIITLQIIICIE